MPMSRTMPTTMHHVRLQAVNDDKYLQFKYYTANLFFYGLYRDRVRGFVNLLQH